MSAEAEADSYSLPAMLNFSRARPFCFGFRVKVVTQCLYLNLLLALILGDWLP